MKKSRFSREQIIGILLIGRGIEANRSFARKVIPRKLRRRPSPDERGFPPFRETALSKRALAQTRCSIRLIERSGKKRPQLPNGSAAKWEKRREECSSGLGKHGAQHHTDSTQCHQQVKEQEANIPDC